jgi:hypothetical protein
MLPWSLKIEILIPARISHLEWVLTCSLLAQIKALSACSFTVPHGLNHDPQSYRPVLQVMFVPDHHRWAGRVLRAWNLDCLE